ncbi:MAG: DarT ssDNA thymidine ADP-ribosyltransferase family protein [Acidobacteriota bacterium]
MKSDAEQYREFLSGLSKRLSLDRIRAYWTKYAFHFTEIRNAACILASGGIKCRAALPEGSFIDAACPRVIAQTDPSVKSYVRLYFRPRTPTQYRSEGLRPRERYWEGSHCPVPVFFLFDLFTLLVRDDCLFSDGNLARLGFDGLCNSADELATFDFSKIYHDTWVSKEELRDTVAHQNAELVIPDELDLSALKLIYCRTAAERETLLYLLPPKIRNIWSRRIAVASTATLFYRKWAFVENAALNRDKVVLSFSPDPKYAEPFQLRLVRTISHPKETITENFSAKGLLPIKFPTALERYNFEVFLDDNLAYAGSFDEKFEEQPF